MLIVTGASGWLGSLIVDRLLAIVPADQVGVSVRDPAKVTGLSKRGVRVRKGDFAEPESLTRCFEGATNVLIVSSNARAHGGDTLAQHRTAIDAAKAAGAQRIVYTSHMAASADSAFPPMHDHAATEEYLRDSGVPWTALRNGFYAESALTMTDGAASIGVLEAPADGKVSWTAHSDLAEAAARVIAGRVSFTGPTPPLTGLDTLAFTDLAEILSEVTGNPVIRKVISDADFEAKLADRGVPPKVIPISLGYYRAARAGEFSHVENTLQEIIGRVPTTLKQVVQDRCK